MENPLTFVFIGQSGSGKGTQADLIQKYLEKKDPKREIFHLETGKRFRQFIKKNLFASRLSSKIYQKGGLHPEFLAVWMWADLMVNNLEENQHMLIDGSPRKLHEAHVLDSAFEFFGRHKPFIIYLNISDQEVMRRLLKRKRLDDNEDDIKNRISWYHSDVWPTIEYYRENKKYNFLDIDGSKDSKEVHSEIIKAIEKTI